MDDFVYVLAAAAAVLVALMIITGISPYSPVEDVEVITNFSVGNIGYTVEMPTRIENLGNFVVGSPQPHNLKTVPSFEISAGWFGQSSKEYVLDVPEWIMDDVAFATAEFDVYNTNQYGNLVIEWNGRKVFAKRADNGHHKITIDSGSVESSNVLRIRAEGPGMIFWASTVYQMRQFRLDVHYGPERIFPFEVFPTELQELSSGEVRFSTQGGSRLAVSVNGISVYNSTPSGYVSTKFMYTDVPLQRGINLLTFKSDRPMSISNAQLLIYLTSNKIVRKRTFDITESQYKFITEKSAEIKLEFWLDSTRRDGLLEIELNGRSATVQVLKEGAWNEIRFSADYVNEGSNEISFTGTGNWYIGEARLSIVK